MPDFERDGYEVFEGVLDEALMDDVRRHVDHLVASHPELRPEHLGHELMPGDAFWCRLVADDRLLDIAERFIGPDIALFASHYIVKPPFDGQPVLWHQDASYWPLEPMEVVTLWLAVDDATTDNGCLRVIPGTHRLPRQRLRPVTDRDNVLRTEIDAAVDEAAAVDLVLRAGDVEVHHPGIVHGSEPNRSAKRRAGLTIRYIPTSTRILADDWPCDFLLRGSNVPGGRQYRPLPAGVRS